MSEGGSGTNTGGGDFNGTPSTRHGGVGSAFGAALGYRFSDLLRADVTYTHLAAGHDWTGSYPSDSATDFSAHARADIFLLNGYLHARGLAPQRFKTFDPFLGAGIGLARTRLSDITETFNGAFGSNVASGIKVRPAARIGLGLDTHVTEALTLTTTADAYWVGGFSSGNTRTLSGGSVKSIGAWKTSNVATYALGMGLRYSF